MLNFGAVIGAVGGGWLADRFHIKYVLVGMYALAAVSITLLGYKVSPGVLFLLVDLAGASTIGTQIVTYAYAGQFYPMAVRSTGIGWASGVGRSGAILAPIVIGTLVGMALPLEQNFMAIAIPAVIATDCGDADRPQALGIGATGGGGGKNVGRLVRCSRPDCCAKVGRSCTSRRTGQHCHWQHAQDASGSWTHAAGEGGMPSPRASVDMLGLSRNTQRLLWRLQWSLTRQ